MATLISHFYNEEVLLPSWLNHHKNLFEHGIMVDYQSTDNSVNLIKKIVPNWEIRNSRNQCFNAKECDKEIMEIESTISEWKMTLNTTEFLFHHDLNEYLKNIKNLQGIKTTGIIMVDPVEKRDEFYPDKNIITYKHHGYFEKTRRKARSRLLHRFSNGNYTVGRHDTYYEKIPTDPNLMLCWFGWSPFNAVRQRKLQIQNKIPQKDKDLKVGAEHIMTPQMLENTYLKETSLAQDLLQIKEYKTIYDKIISKYI